MEKRYMQANPYPLRLDEILMAKVKAIAALERRSINKEIERMVELAVERYEKEHGEVFVPFET